MNTPIVLDGYDLAPIVNFIQTRYALAFTEHNANQLKQAVKARCQACGLNNPLGYLDIITHHPEEERTFINAITTGETCFYRYPQMAELFLDQFSEKMAQQSAIHALPNIQASTTSISPAIRILHIGCSTGEEPYTTAMLLHQQGLLDKTQVQISAFDLNALSIQHAMARRYSAKALRNIPPMIRKRYFQEHPNQQFELTPEIANLVNFHCMSVFKLAASPLMQTYDFIFCMNVMIYFDQATIKRLIMLLKQLMTEDSRLYLAPTDSIMQMNEQFQVHRNSNGFWYGLANFKQEPMLPRTNGTAGTTSQLSRLRERSASFRDHTGKSSSLSAQAPAGLALSTNARGRSHASDEALRSQSAERSPFVRTNSPLLKSASQLTKQQDRIVRQADIPTTDALYELGLQAYEQKDLNLAEQYFQSSIQHAEKVTDCQLALAKIYADRGHAVQAAEMVEALLMNTQNDEAYVLLGILNLQAGNHLEAKALFHRSLSLNANNTEARHFLSFLNTSPEAP
jgi:chemotaxis protein methyltransferase CheR